MDNEDEGARLTQREENRELIAKHRAEVEMLAESIVERATVATPLTDAAVVQMERLDGDIDVVVDAYFARTLERELIDLKQRLLPQANGRAQRAEHERDALLEELIVRRTTNAFLHGEINGMREKLRAATSMPCAPSATAAPGTEPRGCPTPGACSCPAVRVEVGAIRDAALEEAAKEVDWHACRYLDSHLKSVAAGVRALKGSRMKGEPDRPDWAQQLPGAEIFDRAARGDHGYDRTASLSAGRYVCTCGACSCPDAREQPK